MTVLELARSPCNLTIIDHITGKILKRNATFKAIQGNQQLAAMEVVGMQESISETTTIVWAKASGGE